MSIQLIVIIIFLVIMIFVAYAFAFSNQYRLNKTINRLEVYKDKFNTDLSRYETIVTYLSEQYDYLTKEKENDKEI